MSNPKKSLLETAKEAASAVHANTSVDVATTIERLGDLRDHVELLIEACEADEGEE
jgi:hypothetical protein